MGDQGNRIMVVDDDPSFRELLTAFLEGQGFVVEAWSDGEAALREIGFKGWCAAEVGGGDLDRLKEVAKNMESALNCSDNQG